DYYCTLYMGSLIWVF
nr:immunoglobulin light chain junction region [Macaca mulatta]MOW03616.1 immunoglobulin light chain junction region [Macaca mulatta]MOW03787.1 immunoglobulin light chain junction region [Macaca mulatta]MOW03947.1 immunoglobulin light chain junction region [Macaca mulatta]